MVRVVHHAFLAGMVPDFAVVLSAYHRNIRCAARLYYVKKKFRAAYHNSISFSLHFFQILPLIVFDYQPPNMASIVPAATAVPITPATFGPIACINK